MQTEKNMKSYTTPEQLTLFDAEDQSSAGRSTAAVEAVLRDLADGMPASRLSRLSHIELSCLLLRFGGRPRSLRETGTALGLLRPAALVVERRAIRTLADVPASGNVTRARRAG